MRIGKLFRILLSSLSALVLVSILLPVLLSLLLSLPTVQNLAGRVAVGWLGDKIGTEVSLEQLRLKLFNRIEIKGLYVEDYHGDTLFYADRIGVPLQQFNPFTGKLALGEVQLEAPRFYLMQDSTGTTNLKQILLRLKRKEPKPERKPFRLKAGRLAIHDMVFRHRKRDRIERPGAVNFTDLEVHDFNLRVHHVQVINDSIHLDIDSLRLHEVKSGFRINKLSVGHLSLSGHVIDLEELFLDTPDSRVQMDYFRMEHGPNWQAMRNFLDDVTLRAEMVDSRVSFRTIGYFAPSLARWETLLDHVHGRVEGSVADLRGRLEQVRTRETEVTLGFELKGIPDISRTRFTVTIDSLRTREADATFLLKDIAHTELTPEITRMLARLGPIGVNGRFDGLLTRFQAEGRLSGGPGTLEVRGDIAPDTTGGTDFAGHLYTKGFDLGEWLDVEHLGRITLHTDLKGGFGGRGLRLNSQADVAALEYNGYTYQDILLNGDFHNRKFTGEIAANDPNMDFKFDGQLDFTDSLPRYDFDLQLRNADLNCMGVNRRDSISRLQTHLVAHASGTNLDNLSGEALLSEMIYVNHLDTVRTGEIRFQAENSPVRKLITMRSAFADLELQGRLSYAHMFDYFKNTLLSYLPSISPQGRTANEEVRVAASEEGGGTRLDDYYLLRMDIKEANNVAGIFLPGLQMAQGTKFSFLFNPRSNVFNLSLTSDFIERNDFFVSKLSLGGRNEGDSISVSLQAEDMFVNGMFMPNFSVLGGVKENTINLASRFNNPENGLFVRLSTVSRLSVDPVSGAPQVRVNFNPSDITSGGQTWRIYAREVLLDSSRVAIDRFTIDNGDQHLMLHGVASRQTTDTLRLGLQRFDLSAFPQLAGAKGYRIEGFTSGMAQMSSVLKEGHLSANIRIDSMQVNRVRLPDMRLMSDWDFQQQRARLSVTDRADGDTLLYGYFRPADGRYLVNADLPRLDLSLLDPVLSGVVVGTRGSARAQLRLTNPEKKMRVDGAIRIDSLATMVDFTRVAYTVDPVEIEVKENLLSLRGATIRDQRGNTGGMDLSFDFRNTANLSYDLHLTPENLQVLGTTMRDNNLFYGTIYASGRGDIRGVGNTLSMDFQATTAGNSQFFMPLNSESSISRADFITFRQPGSRQGADTVQVSRRKQLLLAQQRRAARRTAAPVRMDIGIALNVLPNAEVQLVIDPSSGDVLRGRGNGNLTLEVNPSNNDFTIRGDYNITEGSMQFTLRNIISRTFLLQEGSTIQFTGDPLDAMLNVTAKYSLKASLAPLLASSTNIASSRSTTAVDCMIHMTGRLTDPQYAFDVQVPNASIETQSLVAYSINSQEAMATQFLWLLATKNFFVDTGIDQNLNIGGSGAAATGIDFLTNQLSTLMTSERFSFVPKYTPGSDYNSDEVGGSIYGELIKDRLVFEADMTYSTDQGKVNDMNTPFTGDASLNLLLDPAGNFRLRAFTRTIDKFDQNEGLQETGVGFSYRENFDNARDLRRIFRERREENRRRRAERRREREFERRGLLPEELDQPGLTPQPAE